MDISQILLGENDAFLHCNTPIIEEDGITIEKESPETKSKFDDDVARLKEHYNTESGCCFLPGICIDITLSELLRIVPRQRRRTDAYTTLIKHLQDKYDITLNIVKK